MGEWKAFKKSSGTGWKELEHEAGSGWKALEWESAAIDVGCSCIERPTVADGLHTFISEGNPANTSGTITNICVYMAGAAADMSVGIFYIVSGNTLKCRSAATLTNLSVGENNKAVSLTVVAGDYIGFCPINASNDVALTIGGTGVWYKSNTNCCVVDNETTYTFYSSRSASVYGTG